MRNKLLTISLSIVVCACGERASTVDANTKVQVDSSERSTTPIHAPEPSNGVAADDSLGEYSNYDIILSINVGDEIITGYTGISAYSLDRDSLKSSNYLKSALSDGNNSVILFKTRIKYYPRCPDVSGDKGRVVYHPLDKTKIPLDQIDNIAIKRIVVDDSMGGIRNTLTLSDTAWMNNDPVRCVSFAGYLCSYNLYIHEESKLTTGILAKIEKLLSGHEPPPENKPDDELDHELFKKIIKLDGQKVVILNECSS